MTDATGATGQTVRQTRPGSAATARSQLARRVATERQ